MNWQDVKQQFEEDGFVRDIYIRDADINLWQRVLDAIRERYPVHYSEDAQQQPVPQSMTIIFARRNEFHTVFDVDVENFCIFCLFSTEEEIEFNIDPRNIDCEENFKALAAFMRDIGQVSEREVILTPQNSEKEILIAYNPTSDSWQYSETLPLSFVPLPTVGT